jgi:hypothetical protein
MVRNSICWRVPQVLSDTAVVLTKLGRRCELVVRSAETDCPLDSVRAGIASLVSGRRCVHLEARAGAMAKSMFFISSVAGFSVNAAIRLRRAAGLEETLIRDRRGDARAVRRTIFSLTATYGQSIFEILHKLGLGPPYLADKPVVAYSDALLRWIVRRPAGSISACPSFRWCGVGKFFALRSTPERECIARNDETRGRVRTRLRFIGPA